MRTCGISGLISLGCRPGFFRRGMTTFPALDRIAALCKTPGPQVVPTTIICSPINWISEVVKVNLLETGASDCNLASLAIVGGLQTPGIPRRFAVQILRTARGSWTSGLGVWTNL